MARWISSRRIHLAPLTLCVLKNCFTREIMPIFLHIPRFARKFLLSSIPSTGSFVIQKYM